MKSTRYWQTPNISILDHSEAKLPDEETVYAEVNPRSITEALQSLGIPVNSCGMSSTPSSIIYSYRLCDLRHWSKLQKAIEPLSARLNKNIIFTSSEIGDFALAISREKRSWVNLKSCLLAKTDFTDDCTLSDFARAGKQSDMTAILGYGQKPLIIDIADAPHILAGGVSGSGKSTLLHTMLCSLMFNATPATLGMIMIDVKKVELSQYRNVKFLERPIITDAVEATMALEQICQVMEQRYEDILNGKPITKRILIVIDELTDAIMIGGDMFKRHLTRISQMGRGCGLHLLCCTQNPLAKVCDTLIRSNFNARIGLSVKEPNTARVVGVVGCDRLQGKGDALWQSNDHTKLPERFQVAWTSADDIKAITEYWSSNACIKEVAEDVA